MHIKELIAQNGGMISVATFMNAALSHPEHGYYKTQNPFGKDGDFTTAPEISQMFGELIGAWCASIWQSMGSPPDINLVEIGAGKGTLMLDALRATQGVENFHNSINICMVETSEHLQEIQKNTLHNFSDIGIIWYKETSEILGKSCIFIANELFDALPVYQYVKTEKGWQERCVGLNEKLEFEFVLSPLVITQPSDISGKELKNGVITESCPAMEVIVEQISNNIKEHGGAALFIDYGYIEPPHKSTLQALKKHKYHNVLEDAGKADITYLVDFTKIKTLAENAGINTSGITTQSDFLHFLGIEQRMESLMKNASTAQQKDIKSAYHRLTDKDQMGELFKVISLF